MNHYVIFIMIGLGGALGAMLRHLCALIINKFWLNAFPLATFSINILGSFIIGFLIAYLLPKFGEHTLLKYLLTTGFCGGFTTFSTFSVENFQLLQEGKFFTLFLYVSSSIIIGILFVFCGLLIGRSIP